jgi:hypothetical protein
MKIYNLVKNKYSFGFESCTFALIDYFFVAKRVFNPFAFMRKIKKSYEISENSRIVSDLWGQVWWFLDYEIAGQTATRCFTGPQ